MISLLRPTDEKAINGMASSPQSSPSAAILEKKFKVDFSS
jgi:hypothetical protein